MRVRAHARRREFLEDLATLVAAESPTADAEACAKAASTLREALATRGARLEEPPPSGRSPHLIARIPSREGTSTLLLAHYDTVWPVGTLATRPFRVSEDLAFGPGVLDMKGGICAALSALEVLREEGLGPAGPTTILATSDEETGSSTSRALIESEAATHDRVLVLEPGAGDFDARTARKGVGRFGAHFHGVPAHAGNEPHLGASALNELARFILWAGTLADEDSGTTITVGRAGGGTAVNVVPAEAWAELDLRVWSTAESDRVSRALAEYSPVDPRVRVTVSGELNRPPLEFGPENRRLHGWARRLAALLGRSLGEQAVGGGSDGSFTSALGRPTLDGMGACGEGPHRDDEHVRIHDTLDRVALLALLLVVPPPDEGS